MAESIEHPMGYERRMKMHVINAWLPPPVAEQTKREAEAFASVVRSVLDSWRPDDPDSVFSTLKWISIIDTFLKARSEINLADVEALVVVGFELFQAAQNKLYAQVRWGNVLIRILKKYGKKMSVKVKWRPFYDSLVDAHFKRNTGPEGWRLRQQHFETITSLVRCCRKYFSPGSASEIWNEFRYSLENPWNNASFEGCGFLQLFLPVNVENEEFFTSDWIKLCIDRWESVPNCHFWDVQWASVLARCIKNFKSLDWELFLPALFTKYLNMFEVPVPSGNGSYPFPLDVPKSTAFLFSKKSGSTAKAISVSIVHLLKPGSSAIEHFKKFADLLEQYYHPSNGGRWTSSLERLLRYLVITFQRRLQDELNLEDKYPAYHLGKAERASFVEVVMKLIDRGQYSKNESLSETVAVAMSILSYVEPSLMLPFITSRFHMALETVTATHQLKTAISSVAFSSRAIFFASTSSSLSDTFSGAASLGVLLTVSLSNALLGMDANDPPKTLATMQLIGSIFSNLAAINEEGPPVLEMISFADWLDEFFSRLFALLLHLEPRSVLHEDAHISSSTGTFLVEDNPYFFAMLEVVLGKLSKPLYMQSLRKISKFVNTNVLPGAIAEVGLLCCACVSANPEEAAHHIIEPVLTTIVSSLQESPVSGYGGKGILDASFSPKATISPALETSLEYHLKVLSVAISYAGPALLSYKDKLKLAVSSAFEAPSWKVNGAGDHLLRSLLGSLVLYYPRNQYKCFSCHPACSVLEDWMQSKFDPEEVMQNQPEWHIPCEDELIFANELLNIHFCSALNDLLTICGTGLHSEAGNEKDHLKVTLLRIFSSLQGVVSCLPELRPLSKPGIMKNLDHDYFFIAGASGATVGSSKMREKAAQDIHVACKYVLGERTDDSILLLLLIRIMDAIANIGSLENEEWSNHMQAWKLESASIIEPSCNFIVPTQTKGKKRPRWALIDKAYMHNTWRSSQSFYHKFRTDSDLSPPSILVLLMEDLVNLSLHRYETVRSLASRSLIKIFKRWPSLISNSVGALSAKLLDSSTTEHEVLGCCAVLGSHTVLKHLTMDAGTFSSFIIGLLASSHHESLKAQKSITELFIKYNIHFSGVPRSLFRRTNDHSEGVDFTELLSQIRVISFDSNGLHWRYDLMANRVLLLLILTSRRDSNLPSKILLETTGHFLKNLSSQLPQSRMLAVSALNALLSGGHHTYITEEQRQSSFSSDQANSISDESLSKLFQEEGFFDKTLTSLSHVHIISDIDGASKGHQGKSLQTTSDKAITLFYFDFSASWPRTPSWISLLRGHTFYSSFARIFKRLTQECGIQTVLALQSTLEELLNTKEKPKQCVAAEAMAGILHSDIDGLLDVWKSWIMVQLQKIIASPSMESMPEWAACIRYAVTGKGKYGTRAPVLRNKILDALLCPLPRTAATNIVTKRYAFLLAVFTEISPKNMITKELEYHHKLMEELMEIMTHSSAQVREIIGAILPILCSNLRLFTTTMHINSDRAVGIDSPGGESWAQILLDQASERAVNIQNPIHFENLHISTDSSDENGFLNSELQNDIKRMETMFHFIISSLKSGRSSFLLDIIVGFLYPVIALLETSHKDMSTLAKAAFELLKWRILPRPHLEKAISVLSFAANDPNWRTRNASLSYLRVFMYRHVFILSDSEKRQIWTNVEKLLRDTQVEVREHAAGVLAGLMKGGDELIISSFRERSFAVADELNKKRKQRNWNAIRSMASAHGAVLALAASVLSVPYDMPSWLPAHVTLLARFISEPSPIKTTVTKAVAEFRRTHADTWIIQKDLFTDEQLEVLADTSSSASYFA